MGVKNRFKGLDLIDRVPEEQWMEAGIKTTSRKRNAKRKNGSLRRPYKQLGKEEKQKAKEKRKNISRVPKKSKEG